MSIKVSFRPAKPEDVTIAVPLIYSSGPPSFEYVFKVSEQKDAQSFLRYAFVRPGCEFSYTNHICVLDESQNVIAIGSTFGSKEVNSFTFSAIKFIFSCYGFRKGIQTILRGLQVEKIIPPPKGNTAVLAHLAVLPEWRGKGIGSKMVTYFLKKAKKEGRATASLDVSLENLQAKALYDRLGFIVENEAISNLKNEFSYVANHYKMVKVI